MSERRIELRDVGFGYIRDTPVLDGINLSVEAGITLVVGPNGGGKSTLLKLTAGVEMPDRGSVSVGGHDLWRDEVEARRDLAYLPEEPDLTPYASVLEVLQLVCRLRNEPLAEAVHALERAGLQGLGNRSVRQLSKGQRRRALLGAAWIGRPLTLLLDEPFDAIDRGMRQQVVEWLREVREQGGLALVVSHEFDVLEDLADRVIAVEAGRVHPFDDLPQEPQARRQLLGRLARGDR